MKSSSRQRTGKHLHLGNLYIILRNHFYYGSFEYPQGGGQWYQGKHTPLISKALFDQVQEKIAVQITKGDSKEFAFTKLMSCGLCGSSITADEKFKHQKNGNIHRYVYYGCTKHNDKNCKSGYINEEELVVQLAGLMDQIDLDSIGMKEKIKIEIERHKKFQSGLLGQKESTVTVSDIDIRNYAKYILHDGQIYEKRELLLCIKSKIQLAHKIVTIGGLDFWYLYKMIISGKI
jgi:hypothetical protein